MIAPAPVTVEWSRGGTDYRAVFSGPSPLKELHYRPQGCAGWLPASRGYGVVELVWLVQEAEMHRQAKEQKR